ncbi:MAG: nucleotidyltransferase family protein [Chloroflexi bacterium]|nr:nucleotidyltransferase family protein [Chloroflexota bacterium]
MKIPDLTFGSEWALMELLCLGLKTHDEQQAFTELIKSDTLDWGVLLEQALRHKMLPLLAFHTLATEPEQTVPRRVQDHFRSALNLNRHKRTIVYQEVNKIIKFFGEQGVQVLGRKDIAFESTLYNGNGTRRFGDIDLLIAPQDRETVLAALPQLGYQIGLFEWQTQKIVPVSRKTMMIFRMNPDHLPVHARLTGDPVMQWLEVDFANSLTWHGSDYNVPLDVAMANIHHQPIAGFPDIKIPCLAPAYQFIGTVLHLFREAWFERWLEWEQDVDLTKFSDVIRLWRTYEDILSTESFVQTLEELGIVDPLVWVLEHLDRTFQTDIVATLGLEGRVSETWLFSGRASGRQLYQWRGSMRERLYSKDRHGLFVEAEGVQ